MWRFARLCVCIWGSGRGYYSWHEIFIWCSWHVELLCLYIVESNIFVCLRYLPYKLLFETYLYSLIKLIFLLCFWLSKMLLGKKITFSLFVLNNVLRSATVISMTSWLVMVGQGELAQGRLLKKRLKLKYLIKRDSIN